MLEYNARPAAATGRCAAATTYTELGGATSTADSTQAITSIPARGGFRIITTTMLHYCDELGVKLEPFIQVNHNAYLHSTQCIRRQAAALPRLHAGLPRPRRRAARASRSMADMARCAADKGGRRSCSRRCALRRARQGTIATPQSTTPAIAAATTAIPAAVLLGKPLNSRSRSRRRTHPVQGSGDTACDHRVYEFQPTLFQPVGGMGRIGEASDRELGRSSAIPREGRDEDRAERTRRHSRITKTPRNRARRCRRARTGACARFRCRS